MQNSNKKIINASPLSWGGIDFKSKLEVMVYKTLLENGITPQYEPIKYTIWNGYKPLKAKFYDKDRSGLLRLNDKKIISITYTPDFVFDYGFLKVFIEAKGIENDVFYIKKKLFRKYLEDMTGCIPFYFEIHSKKQLIQALNIIETFNNDYMGRIKMISDLFSNLVIKGDKELCEKFLAQRKFVQLKEIVDANVTKAEKMLPNVFDDRITNKAIKEEETYNNLKQLQEYVNAIAKDFEDPIENYEY